MNFFGKTKQKYHAHKFTDTDGRVWDSKGEYSRWCHLVLQSRAGLITNLRRQVSLEVVPRVTEQYPVQLKTKVIQKERVVEQACNYIADFVYDLRLPDGSYQTVYEDFKGVLTPEFKLKRKVLLYYHGINIRVVKNPNQSVNHTEL